MIFFLGKGVSKIKGGSKNIFFQSGLFVLGVIVHYFSFFSFINLSSFVRGHMASIQLTELSMRSPNPAFFTDPFSFSFSLNVNDNLSEDLEVCFIWVGSAGTNLYDQKLEELAIGPLVIGRNVFVAQVPAPRWDLIPEGEILGETLLIVSLRYCDKEFVRVGYWVNVAYIDAVDNTHVPQNVCIDRIARTLSVPSVHSYPINWLGTLH